MKKVLIFDSSTIITLALNNLLYILEPLKKQFKGEFYIPEPVKREIIDRSLKIRRFMLEALMIKKLINKKIILVVNNKTLRKETQEILSIANNTFQADGEFMKIIQEGEAACLALYKLLIADKKAISVDERTTRMIVEAPANLRKLLQSKLHKKIKAKTQNYPIFRDFNIIRSAELVFLAYKKGIIKLPASKSDSITALLYATRYKGCAISNKEIEAARKIIQNPIIL